MNILVLTYWSYKEPLIQAATLPHLELIYNHLPPYSQIHLVTFEKPNLQILETEIDEVNLHLSKIGTKWLPMKYRNFGPVALVSWLYKMLKLIRFCHKNDVKAIHAFASTAGIAAEIIHRFTSIPYVIDSYEPHAESMVENGSWKKGSTAFKLLFHFEKKQARKAQAVLATSQGMASYSVAKYGACPKRFFVKPACVNLKSFHPNTAPHAGLKKQLEGKITCVYAGKLGGIYLRSEVFDFFKACVDHWGDQFVALMLTDTPADTVANLSHSAGVETAQVITRNVHHSEVPSYLALAQFAINPVMPVPSKRYCTSIKDGEYWAMGLPVVIPANISDDSAIIKAEHAGAVLNEFNPEAYQNAVSTIEELLNDSESTGRIRSLAERYRGFKIADEIYEKLYGAQQLAVAPRFSFIALIYNSYGDPLYQNLMHQYLLKQSENNPMFEVDLITFEQPKYEIANVPSTQASLTKFGIRWHPLVYHSGRWMLWKKLYDFASAMRRVAMVKRQHKTKKIIAFANTSAAITVIISRLFSIPMVIYSYEPHSEFLAEFGIWKRSGLRYKILSRLELAAQNRSKYILTGTQHMVDYLSGRVRGKVLRAPSAVNPDMFQFDPKARDTIRSAHGLDTKKVMIYVGKFGGIYYRDEIAEFFGSLYAQDDQWRLIVLTPDEHGPVRAMFDSLPSGVLTITEAQSPKEVAEWLSASDIGLSAIPPLPAQKFRSPVKVGEYLLCGLPYITCQNVSEDDLWALKENVGIVIESMDQPLNPDQIKEIDLLLVQQGLREKCRQVGLEYRNIETVHKAFEESLS